MRVLVSKTFEFLRLAWQEDRRRFSAALGLILLQASALPLLASAMGALTDAALARDAEAAIASAWAIAGLAIAALTAGHFAHIFYFELGESLTLRLQSDLSRLSNGSPGIEHHERPDYADKLQVLRQEISRTGPDTVGAIVGGFGLGVGILITAFMLGGVNPWLLLLPLGALPPLLLGRRAEAALGAAREAAASATRLSRHLLMLTTEAGPAKELRVCGLEGEIQSRLAQAWGEASGELWRGERRALALRLLGQVLFATTYVGATLLVVWDAATGQRSVGDVILAVVLAGQVNQQVTSAVALHQELQRVAQMLSDLNWIDQLVRDDGPRADPVSPPSELASGLSLERVSFTYPGTAQVVLDDVSVHLPAGSTVAIVGENGAGKSTLVKLLCGFYQAQSGSIRVDGVDLRHLEPSAWRERISVGFQDFVKFEFSAREAIGVGHLPDAGSDAAVRAALGRAQSDDLLSQLPKGLDTELGKSNAGGTELSGGQWQKVALARAMMRERPLLLVLDEPTAALDARAEHLLFEQYAASAKRAGANNGAVTVLVSHRFSTVRMAEKILVVSNNRLSEVGSHAELMQQKGLYAELYGIQAAAYR